MILAGYLFNAEFGRIFFCTCILIMVTTLLCHIQDRFMVKIVILMEVQNQYKLGSIRIAISDFFIIKQMIQYNKHHKSDKQFEASIQISKRKNRLLKFCYVPATSAAHTRLLFFFLLQTFTVLMKRTCAIKQSIYSQMSMEASLQSCQLCSQRHHL